MNSLNILKAREEKLNIINKYINYFNVITLKINMVGNIKNNNLAISLLNYSFNLIKNYELFKNIPYEYINSIDGDYYLFKFNKDSFNLKEECIKIEETSPIGRLIDLDVYLSSFKSINRDNPRKCIVCNCNAFDCIRSNRHTYSEIINNFKIICFESFSNKIKEFIYDSALKELNLENKFGCVSKLSNGSHNDINYDLMVNCINIITPYFIEMFKVGYFNDNNYFIEINKIGKNAEQIMFDNCKTNCYKGLILCLGVLVCAFGIYISRIDNLDFKSCLNLVIKDYNCELKSNTFGYKVFKELNFGGIRKEAKNLFPTIFNVIDKIDINDNNSIYKCFIDIVKLCDDSVLLKRSGSIEKYNYYKELIINTNLLDKNELEKNNIICINNSISLGGSCDLLVCTIFIKNVFNYFYKGVIK